MTVHEAVRDAYCGRPACRRQAVEALVCRREADAEQALEVTARRYYAAALAHSPPGADPAPAYARVPHLGRPLEPAPVARHRAFLHGLVPKLRAAAAASAPAPVATVSAPEPPVVQIACGTCRGHCCKDGVTHAFLDVPDLAAQLASTGLRPVALLAAYRRHLPGVAVRNSCVFHARDGCALPRAMRAPICNSFRCVRLPPLLATAAAVGDGDLLIVGVNTDGTGAVRRVSGREARVGLRGD